MSLFAAYLGRMKVAGTGGGHKAKPVTLLARNLLYKRRLGEIQCPNCLRQTLGRIHSLVALQDRGEVIFALPEIALISIEETVAHERRFARSRNAGDGDEFAERNRHLDVFQIVLARAANAD